MSSREGAEPAVTDDGIVVPRADERIFDLRFDGRRIWSFRAGTGTPYDEGRVLVGWPAQLGNRLRGSTTISVADQAGVELVSREVRFDDADERVAITDAQGRPLVLDSKGRLALPFESDDAALGPLLDAAHRVFEVLATGGVDAFLAYGTLLGAVREGNFIGHDNDIDLGYVSAHRQPVDVIGESFRLERALERAGLTVERYSGAGFKVLVRDGAGVARWIDVFGGFWHGDRLALMGELLTRFERDWLVPLSTVELAGRTFPAPALPEKLLEAMYGPGWRVPDPTFAFDADTDARHQLNHWFRGIRQQRNRWDRAYSGRRHSLPLAGAHELAAEIHRAEPDATVVDVGCGRGTDVAWLASQGHRAIGLDFSAWAMEALRAEGQDEFHTVNLLELRQVLGWGTRLSRIPGPKVMMARHLLDAAPPRARQGMWRLARMVLGDGGRLHAEFYASTHPRPRGGDALVWELDPRRVEAEAAAAGAHLLDTTWHEPSGAELGWGSAEWSPTPHACRMVWEWR